MITSRKIRENIKKQPPMQREATAKSYRGISINWKLKFKSARPASHNLKLLRVSTEPPGHHMYPDIVFDVNEKDHAEINILHEDAPLWVTGKIRDVQSGGLQIDLDLETIRFTKESPKKVETQTNVYSNSNVRHEQGNIVNKNANINLEPLLKQWYEKPLGIIMLTIISGLIIAGTSFWLGWGGN